MVQFLIWHMTNPSSSIVTKWMIKFTIKYHYLSKHHSIDPKKIPLFKTYLPQDNSPHLKYPKPKLTRKIAEISDCYGISPPKLHEKMRGSAPLFIKEVLNFPHNKIIIS